MSCVFYTYTFIIFIWGKVLEKSARPGFEPGTLGFLAQCSTDWAIEAGIWTSQQNQPTTAHIATTLSNVLRSRSRWFFRTVGVYIVTKVTYRICSILSRDCKFDSFMSYLRGRGYDPTVRKNHLDRNLSTLDSVVICYRLVLLTCLVPALIAQSVKPWHRMPMVPGSIPGRADFSRTLPQMIIMNTYGSFCTILSL